MLKKKQLGGFSLPPSLMTLFEDGSPTFEQVMALAPQLDAMGGTDVFSRAFAEDNPNLIGGAVASQGALATATAANPLRTPEEIEDEAKKRTFLGIGKKRATRKLEEENQRKAIENQMTGIRTNVQDTQMLANAAQMFDMLGSWFGQQGGNPFQPTGSPQTPPTPGVGTINRRSFVPEPLGTPGEIAYPTPGDMAATIRKRIMSLPDNKEGRAKLMEYLSMAGYPLEGKTPDEQIKNFKKQGGYNISPSKGPTPNIDDDLRNFVAEEVSSIQYYTSGGADGRELREMQGGGNVFDPYKPAPGLGTALVQEKGVTDTRSGVMRAHDKLIGEAKVKAEALVEKMAGVSKVPHGQDYNGLQHAAAAMYTASKQGPVMSPLRAGYTLGLGLAHEIAVPNEVYETVTDLVNNGIGTAIGALPVPIKTKEALLKKAFEAGALGVGKVLEPEEMQQGGAVSKLGYSDNSPYRGMPAIDIPGNNITMENTGMPLLAVPDAGAPRVMAPYSGNHVFPGASTVKEIPMPMKKGGRKFRKIPMYQMGNGPAQEMPPMAVQLEEGEVFSTPELDIIDTNAREKHKQMDKDLITDIMGPENYVFSADPRMTVSRKRAEDVSLGLSAVKYEEGEIGEMPVEITAADIMDEKVEKMIIADYVKAIRRKYPISDREDVFARKTNEANKGSRLPYMAAATLFNEEKRTKGKAPMSGFVSNYENRFDKSYTSMAGIDVDAADEGEVGAMGVMPGPTVQPTKAGPPEIPKGQEGLDFAGIGSLANLAGQIFGVFTNASNRKTARRALQNDVPNIDKLARTQGTYSDLAYGAQAAGLMQDPTVDAPQYDTTQLDARRRNVSPSLFQLAAARAMAGNRPFLDAAFANSGDFATAVNAYSSVQAPALGMLADLGMREVETNLGLENTYRDMKQNLGERQELADVTARNATRTNANRLTGAMGQTMAGAIGSRGKIEASRQNAHRANAFAQAQAKIDANAAATQAVQNVGATMTNAGYVLDQTGWFGNQGAGVDNNVAFTPPPTYQSGQIGAFGALPATPDGAYGMPNMVPEGYVPQRMVGPNGEWVWGYVPINQ